MTILSDSEIKELCTTPKFVSRLVLKKPKVDRTILLIIGENEYFIDSVALFKAFENKGLCKPSAFVSVFVEGSCAFFVFADNKTQSEERLIRALKPYLIDRRDASVTTNIFTVFQNGLYTASEPDLIDFGWKPMITPFEPQQVKTRKNDHGKDERIISYGVSSYGYDIRAAPEFRVFTNVNTTLADPKNFDPKSFVEINEKKVIIPPNSFALARSLEAFSIPRDVMTVCLGKSTLARVGCVVGVTPFEPEWEGYATLEFSNTTPLPMVLYANEGCAQILFFQGNKACDVSYGDRAGKYQNQVAEPISAKV